MQRTLTALTALVAGITSAEMDIQINISYTDDEEEATDSSNYDLMSSGPEPYSAINEALDTFCWWFLNNEEHGDNLMCDINEN